MGFSGGWFHCLAASPKVSMCTCMAVNEEVSWDVPVRIMAVKTWANTQAGDVMVCNAVSADTGSTETIAKSQVGQSDTTKVCFVIPPGVKLLCGNNGACTIWWDYA